MSTPKPYLGLTAAAFVVDVRRTKHAMGLGPEGFSGPLVASSDATATPETEPTGFFEFDNNADSDLVATLEALCGGDVPGLDINGNPIMWGEDGIISQADAIAAFAHPNVKIIGFVGVSDTERDGIFASVIDDLGYKRRPEAD